VTRRQSNNLLAPREKERIDADEKRADPSVHKGVEGALEIPVGANASAARGVEPNRRPAPVADRIDLQPSGIRS